MFSAFDISEGESRINPSEISMIADDLAGACDTGIEFFDSVGCVTVVVDSDIPEMKNIQFEGLAVWNTESRSLSEYDACSKVCRACEFAGAKANRILLKKTDSLFEHRLDMGRPLIQQDKTGPITKTCTKQLSWLQNSVQKK